MAPAGVRLNWQLLLSSGSAALIGAVAWRAWWLIALALAIPMVVCGQRSRWQAALTAVSYYGAASWPIIESYRSFAGDLKPSLVAVLLWALASALLSLPLAAAWSENRRSLLWRTPLALFVTAVPPLGLIVWASPLAAAGVVFPGMAWLGLVATAFLPSVWLTSAKPFALSGPFVGASLLTHLISTPLPLLPHWEAVETSIALENRSNPAEELLVSEAIQARARHSNAHVVVFPESVIPRWNAATEDFWEPTVRQLTADRKILVLGTGLSRPGSTGYENVALLVGSSPRSAFIQRIPVPIGMWQPFATANSVPLRLRGAGTIAIAGERVAPLICYEQLLVWPMLHSALERPTVIIGMANQHWIRNTSVPATQRACLRAWSRLFALPLLIAENQ